MHFVGVASDNANANTKSSLLYVSLTYYHPTKDTYSMRQHLADNIHEKAKSRNIIHIPNGKHHNNEFGINAMCRSNDIDVQLFKSESTHRKQPVTIFKRR